MKTFDEFLIEKDNTLGYYPKDYDEKLQTTTSGLMLEYVRYIASVDGRTLKWHITKAIEMYIQQLTDK